MRNPARLVLIAILMTGLPLGAIGPFIHPGEALGYVLLAISGLAQSFLIFLWYRLDAQKRGFRRSRLLNTGIAGFTTLALPYYLFRTRGFLRGLLAIVLAFLLVFGTLLTAAVGGIAGYLAVDYTTKAGTTGTATEPAAR